VALLRIRRSNARSVQTSPNSTASTNGSSPRRSLLVEPEGPITHSAITGRHSPAQPLPQPAVLHSESKMLLHTKHIRGGLSVHVCYTNDIMAVNRWIRRVIYRDPPITTETDSSLASSSSSVFNSSSSSSSSPPPLNSSPPPLNSSLPLSVGLDVEWKANRSKGEDNHVAVIQLAIRSHILVFHAHLSRLPLGVTAEQVRGKGVLAENSAAGQSQHEAPLELARIFSDPGVRFVGVGVLNDYLKVVRDLRLSIVPLRQLQSEKCENYNLSRVSPPPPPPPPLSFLPIRVAPPPTHSFAAERVVEMSEKWLVGRRISEGHGLKALSVRVLSLQGWNSRSSSSSSTSYNGSDNGTGGINHSQWEQPLSNMQIRYAALDAWSSAVVHDVIERHELRMPEREELERRAAAKSVRKVLLRQIQFGAARLSSAISSNLVSSPSSSATLIEAANVLGVDTVDPTNASFWKEQRSLTLTTSSSSSSSTTTTNISFQTGGGGGGGVKVVDSSQNFSTSDPIKNARSELRNAFVAAMNDSLVKSAAEDVLEWFNHGELTQPQVGGIGHNRAKTPFPKLRRRGLSKARICPDPRFIVDVRAVLGGEGEERAKAHKGGTITEGSSKANAGGGGGGGGSNQLIMLPLHASEYVFGSATSIISATKLPVIDEEKIIFKRERNETFSSSSEFGGSFAYLLEKMH